MSCPVKGYRIPIAVLDIRFFFFPTTFLPKQDQPLYFAFSICRKYFYLCGRSNARCALEISLPSESTSLTCSQALEGICPQCHCNVVSTLQLCPPRCFSRPAPTCPSEGHKLRLKQGRCCRVYSLSCSITAPQQQQACFSLAGWKSHCGHGSPSMLMAHV